MKKLDDLKNFRRGIAISLGFSLSVWAIIIWLITSSMTTKPVDVLYYEVDRPYGMIRVKDSNVDFYQSFIVSTTLYKQSFNQYVKEHSKTHYVVIYKWWIEDELKNGIYNGHLFIRSVLLPKNQPYDFSTPNFKPIYK
jgi:hypothetical protein